MKTIMSVSACWLLLVFIHIEAVKDEDFQSLLVRLSVLEEKQVVLETENKLSQKRIADLEKYKLLSDKRVASLERKIALCHRRQYALDIVKNIALETDKLLSDTTTTTNGYDKTLSDKMFASLVNGRILSDRKIATPENDNEVSHNRSGKDNSYSAAVEIEDRSAAGNVLLFLFDIYYHFSINNCECSFKIS
ncbi:hypothetical protein DPMN_065186 [Dreissena polymorpha]|uniref:Uncharacterized protein n=1 Tax=Dreissena polymorpha TaxID=45954 RepID=A0A9D4CE48_DREPO|nr:hypothetical protein DPMN_065186 [Dreissena polymorpha]